MKSGRMPLLLASSLGLVVFFGLIGFAQAVSISPVTFELNANPGEKVSNYIRIYNDQSFPIGAKIEIRDFIPSGEAGQVVLEQEGIDSGFSLSKWVKVSGDTFTIPPMSSKQFEYEVSVPMNAEPGGHYGSVVVATLGGGDAGGSSISQKVASLLLLNVSGVVKEELSVKSFSAPDFSEYGPITVEARFENTGSVHVKPRGFILVNNIFGREVAKIDMPQSNVLPGSIRKLEIPLGHKYMFGRYDAILTSIYGSTNEPLTAAIQFWVIPWKLSIIVFVALVAVIWFLILIRRRVGLALRILFKGSA